MISKGANTFSNQIFIEVISETVAVIFSTKTQESIMIPSRGCSRRIGDYLSAFGSHNYQICEHIFCRKTSRAKEVSK